LIISPKALSLMVDHIGNDLTRIENEVEKITLNLGKKKTITEDDIEEFVGVSKEFNVFELQVALGKKELSKAIRIIQYFEANPKAAPIQFVLPSLYSFFSKVFMVFGSNTTDEKVVSAATGINPYFIKEYMQAANLYGYAGIEKALLLLHNYNLKSVGVNDAGTEETSLLKEMVIKMVS
jgi:DNA polymerase-3 subunit delta